MSDLSEEQRLMRQSCRDFVDDVIIPFIRGDWQREWSMTPEDRLPPKSSKAPRRSASARSACRKSSAASSSIAASEVQTFALIAEEIARGDSGPRRQAGAELESVGAAAQSGAAAPAGEMVQAADRRPAIPAGALPDRAARRFRPLAALQRAGSRDADARGEAERRMGHQRPQAVHLQRLRRRPVRGLCQHQSASRHDAGHVELSGAARHAGADDRALQRDRSAAAS